MTLQEQLNQIAADSAAKMPADANRIMGAHTESLIESGKAERAVGAGDIAPPFSLDGPDGPISLHDLIAKGPVVLTWFRGAW